MIKRPLVIITISYIIGIIIGLYFEINTALFSFLCLIVIVIIYNVFLKYFYPDTKFNAAFFVAILLAFLISFFVVHMKENKFDKLYSNVTAIAKMPATSITSEIPAASETSAAEIPAIGTVIKIKKDSEYYNNYVIKINSINQNSKFKNTNILLKVKKDVVHKNGTLNYGDSILFYGKYEKPASRKNYKGFDYKQYLKQQNIYIICKSEYNSIKVINKNSLFVGKMWINKFQNNLKMNLNILLNEKNANIANAILLGDMADIDEEQRQTFSDASLIHILAISGMHITYVVLFWSFVLKKSDRRRTNFFIILFLVFFANLTGGSPSVVRASIMSCISVGSKLFYRKSDTINNIALSCLVILIINPYSILNLGFQLSFLGTLGIVLFKSKIANIFSKLEVLIRKKYKIIIPESFSNELFYTKFLR